MICCVFENFVGGDGDGVLGGIGLGWREEEGKGAGGRGVIVGGD